MTLLKKKKMKINGASEFMTPSQARIFNMDYDILLKHYVLIMMKVSSLPSDQRRLVNNRVEYLVNNDTLKQEDLERAINEINSII